MKKHILIGILMCSWAGILHAQEINLTRFENIVKSLKLDKTRIKGEFCTEKKMPNAEDSYIAVLPILQGKEEEDFFVVRNYIVITDENGAIKNQYVDPVGITSDAIMLRSIAIDTGLYTISNGIRAFGVKVSVQNGSQPNPYSSETISLYYPAGKTLKKVLNEFELSNYSAEWDTRCTGEAEDNHSFIMMDKTKTNNFTDLKIKTISNAKNSKEVNGDCKENETSKTSYRILKFKNGKYH
ncbi:hypothetical protein EG346_24345 [Chryseobacterium carnipullorum]|uniref:Uncharacterized protein n=1 Tax=Chryseobacterium carnipullorum TaxID=1124835 RepID=A0A376EAV7_CHRCU|nr:hypothetical protein [Chryseobacterium carnipullorum]AZA51111.1 hypothetical protein EG346_24345 [Chryseobacterium carnipullorum]AZA65967.1 hypothetical protein EG345_15450 [Chryseobacterium carnipullorum]STD04541.1 Uncharacterised protein [Chryseobacterium carnipullorum]